MQVNFYILLRSLLISSTKIMLSLPCFVAAPLTLASLVLSYINFAYSSWKLKTLDHRVQQLPMQGGSVFSTMLWFSWFNCQWVSYMLLSF